MSKKKKAAPKPAKRFKTALRIAKSATKAPAQVPLIRGLRIPSLDRHCASIADIRAAKNRLVGEEQTELRSMHKDMIKHNQMSWQSAGVEVVRVPGDEKLRVHTTKETSTAPAQPPVVEDEELEQAAGELEESIVDTGVGQASTGDSDNPFGED
jgi:hypothetical protein